MGFFRKIASIVSIAAILVTLSVDGAAQADSAQQPKSIILLIGDGMGINQARAADIYTREIMGRSMAINSIRTRGVTTTYSANSEVTDSAAAATALFSGYKSDNGVINMLPHGRKVLTIAQAAKKAGLSVGVVSTTRLTHATPAAVYSHSRRRDDENFIAEQLTELAPEVAMAGGVRHFMPQGKKGSKRNDDKDLIAVMKSKGYAYVTNAGELKSIDPRKNDRLLGLFAMSHMDYELDRENVPKLGSQPSLADMTQAALSILEKNPKGFFVMIEGGRIDHACHAHDIKAAIDETLAFDNAVSAALEYRKEHPDVLVLVTGDHETGGLGLGRGTQYALALTELKPLKNSLEYVSHQILNDPVKLDEYLNAAGFELTEDERAFLVKNRPETKAAAVAQLHNYPRIDESVVSWIHYALSSIESKRAGIGWTSYAHTAQPVITYAAGPGEEEFAGFYDNTDVAKKMFNLLGLPLEEPYHGGGVNVHRESSRSAPEDGRQRRRPTRASLGGPQCPSPDAR